MQADSSSVRQDENIGILSTPLELIGLRVYKVREVKARIVKKREGNRSKKVT